MSGVGPEAATHNAPSAIDNEEKRLLVKLLEKCNGKVARVAVLCGLGKSSVYVKLNEYDII